MTSFELMRALSTVDAKYIRKTDVFYRRAPVWRSIMKKTTKAAFIAASFVLAAGLLLWAWWAQSGHRFAPGNEGTKTPLRICVDLGDGDDKYFGESMQEKALRNFPDDVKLYAKHYVGEEFADSFEIEMELIPAAEEDATARAATLQRIRTEIMSGGGPDVFICATDSGFFGNSASAETIHGNRLFPYVDQAIENGLFLPLDEYLETASIAHVDRLFPGVLAGGKNKEGRQVVLPLTFTVPMLLTEQGETTEEQREMMLSRFFWEELFYPYWMDAADVEDSMAAFHFSRIENWLPPLADREAGRLNFTEEELFDLIKEQTLHYQELLTQEIPKGTLYFPDNENTFGVQEHTTAGFNSIRFDVLPCANGEVAAEVSIYGAVNRNTDKPKAAFFVLDMLLGEDFQKIKSSSIYTFSSGAGCTMPVDSAMGAPDTPITMWADCIWNRQQYEEWVRACGEITTSRFPSALDFELQYMVEQIQRKMTQSVTDGEEDAYWSLPLFAQGEISDEELREIIHEAYGNMQKLLDES